MSSEAPRAFRILMCVLIVCAAGLFSPTRASAQSDWPTYEFEIVESGLLFYQNGLSGDEKNAIQNHLTRTAKYYQSLGFRAPDLEMNRKGTRYVIRFDHGSDLSVAVTSVRSGAPETIIVPRAVFQSVFDGNGKLQGYLAYSLSHELFHTNQRAYPGMQGDTAGFGIMEGTAEAISKDLTVKWGYQGRSDCDGVRDLYATPLLIGMNKVNAPRYSLCKGPQGYGTSGFWRFVGQAKKANKMTRGRVTESADYAYLHDYFESLAELNTNPGAETENRLTNDFLASRAGLKKSLGHVFSTWAASVTGRYAGNKRKKLRNMMNYFGDCQEVRFPETNPFLMTSNVTLKSLTASCYHVYVDEAKGAVDISIHVLGADPEYLLMGMEGGLAVSSAIYIPPNNGSPESASWTFSLPEKRANGTAFVLTRTTPPRVAGNPKSYTVLFSMNSVQTSASAGGGKKASRRTARKPGDPPLSLSEEERAKAAEEAADLTPSYHTSLSGHVSPQPNTRNCKEPFRFMVCGPSLSISLSAMPNSAPDLSVNRATGGGTAQVAQALLGLNDAGGPQAASDWQQAAIDMRTQPGAMVEITIPMLNYGETGTFSNAQIATGNGKDSRLLHALAPADAIKGKGIGFELNGNVTIDKYTLYSMSGSFSGAMVDHQDVPPGDDPSLTVVANISGTFHIARPWRGDHTIEAEPIDWKLQREALERRRDAGGPPPTGGRPPTGPGGNSTSAGGGSDSRVAEAYCPCDCDMQYYSSTVPQCITKCSPVWDVVCPLPAEN